MRWKRPLFLLHRWAGIVLCLFFALWFLSGLFMMYVEFPQLTAPERRAGQPPLDFSSARHSPAAAIAQLRVRDFSVRGTPARNLPLDVAQPDAAVTAISNVRLGMLFGRPVYRVHAPEAQPRTVFADTAEVLQQVTREAALRAAAEFCVRSGWLSAGELPRLRHEGMLQTDQWTVSAALDAHRPLHKIALGDAQDTHLYVSSTTGEVVRDTHRLERGLNYLGAVTHWLYPTFIRRYPDAWEWMVDGLAGAGTVLGISGLWIGILRWRRKRAAGESLTPYRGLMRWHHLTGLAFGLPAVTWVLSGLLSMNPGNLNPPRSPADDEALVFSGKPLTVVDFELPALAAFGATAVAAELLHFDGQPFYKVTDRNGAVRLVPARSSGESQLPRIEDLLARAPALMPQAQVQRAYVLTEYDDYYYTRHPEQGGKSLPVIRVQFDDAKHTWFHVDPTTGQLLERSTRGNRLYRWLYNGLHSWDIRWLWERRPLWDIAVIGFSLGGLALALIGVIAGVRRLRWELGVAPLTSRRTRLARAVPGR